MERRGRSRDRSTYNEYKRLSHDYSVKDLWVLFVTTDLLGWDRSVGEQTVVKVHDVFLTTSFLLTKHTQFHPHNYKKALHVVNDYYNRL